MLWEIGIDIPNYEGNDWFHQNIFVESETEPDFSTVWDICYALHERDSQYEEYIGSWKLWHGIVVSTNISRLWEF